MVVDGDGVPLDGVSRDNFAVRDNASEESKRGVRDSSEREL